MFISTVIFTENTSFFPKASAKVSHLSTLATSATAVVALLNQLLEFALLIESIMGIYVCLRLLNARESARGLNNR